MEHDENNQPPPAGDLPRLTVKPPSGLLAKMLTPLGLGQGNLPSEIETTVGQLVEAWRDQEWPERVAALQTMSRLSTQVPVHFVVQALQDENEYVRAAAARVLGSMGDRAPAQPLVHALYDTSWSVRAASAQALGKIGLRASIDPLVDVMRNDEDASVRASAAQALGRMGKQVPLQPLLLALQDKAWLVREAVASALGESGQHVPVEPLLAVLRDPDASVRQAAQAALQQAHPEAVPSTSTTDYPFLHLEQPAPDSPASITPRPPESEITTERREPAHVSQYLERFFSLFRTLKSTSAGADHLAESTRESRLHDTDPDEIRYFPLTEPPSSPSRPDIRPLPGRSHTLAHIVGVGATLLVVASIIFASLLLFRHPRTSTVSNTGQISTPCAQRAGASVGCAFFKNSDDVNKAGKNNGTGINDILEIDLYNVPEPMAGKSYYAWLLGSLANPESVTVLLHQLTVVHGSIHYVYQDTHGTDLLAMTRAFLITEEDANVQPIGPSPDRKNWRYYSELSQRPDPGDTTNHYSVVDHLHHLLTADPKLELLGLHGGLAIWLERNTQDLMRLAQKAQDAYRLKDAQTVRKQLIGMLDYLDGSVYVQTDVPSGTPLQIDSSVARVAVLTFDALNQEPPGYVKHIVSHLSAIAINPYGTSYQRTLATRLTTTLNAIDVQFQQIHIEVKGLVDMDNSQLLQSAAKAKLDSMVAQMTLLYKGRVNAATQQVQQEGVVQVYQAMQTLATFAVQMYK